MIVLTRSDTRGLLELEACVDAVERAFGERGRGEGLEARRFHVAAREGAFHVTAGGVGAWAGRPAFGLKVNGRYPPAEPGGNQRVSGAILLADAEDGRPLALLDSLVVTVMRTAAVTVVAARHLARTDAHSALLVGAGTQGRMQVEALALAGGLERLAVHDQATGKAEALAGEASDRGFDARVVEDVDGAAADADVVVTVTPARSPVLTRASPGCLVVALGADGPGKRELGPGILSTSKVVVDILDQAAHAGELSSAIRDGEMGREEVYGELGEIVAGAKPGRASPDETIVFDATGTALQDVAASLLLIEAARREGRGTELRLDG
ncbi:MAG: hypothetical protein GWM92_08920 [Gemmatimonadetes bacterium]|nr:hypothetical protein [Gemmatimonadota bacterium]NIR78768.1 hypothetical protein [Gemmatimonadota bacterium]NIT87402.1 hypothetical protein [Gemmatimonadota bacterium]NIU31258.1 hypothetical protein [Gemmatimonadota bacterium]NIU35967.1 hypothetical protein [Gemmatimonadota bacterium]